MKRLFPLLCVALLAVTTSAQFTETEVPAYHPNPPAKTEKLPAIASTEQLEQMNLKYDFQRRAYEAAAKVPRALYQLPCYCFCDRSAGHQSLHSCFEGSLLRLSNDEERQDCKRDPERHHARRLQEHRLAHTERSFGVVRSSI